MRILYRQLILSACLLCAHFAFGQKIDTIAAWADKPIAILTDGDSVKHFVGKRISVIGKVLKVGENEGQSGSNVFLEMFRLHPENPFNVPIFSKYRKSFEPVNQFDGKTVLITGQVNKFDYTDKEGNFKTGISIILRYPEQIKILD